MKCDSEDTVGDLKKLIAAQTGTDSSKIQLKKWCVFLKLESSLCSWHVPLALCTFGSIEGTVGSDTPHRYTIYKDHITLADYEIHDGMSLEMY